MLMVGGVIGAQFGASAGESSRASTALALRARSLVCLRIGWDLVMTPAELYSIGTLRRASGDDPRSFSGACLSWRCARRGTGLRRRRDGRGRCLDAHVAVTSGFTGTEILVFGTVENSRQPSAEPVLRCRRGGRGRAAPLVVRKKSDVGGLVVQYRIRRFATFRATTRSPLPGRSRSSLARRARAVNRLRARADGAVGLDVGTER